MLKPIYLLQAFLDYHPAAFGRLCVETVSKRNLSRIAIEGQPPSGGCVLKLDGFDGVIFEADPAAFGRLCVETMPYNRSLNF